MIYLPPSKVTWQMENPPFLMGNASSNGAFSIAMLVYRRVDSVFTSPKMNECLSREKGPFLKKEMNNLPTPSFFRGDVGFQGDRSL